VYTHKLQAVQYTERRNKRSGLPYYRGNRDTLSEHRFLLIVMPVI